MAKSIGRRLGLLEGQITAAEDEQRRAAYREFIERLTFEELEWLSEPGDEAESLVPCPHVELVKCGCRGPERARRGFEAYPELLAERVRRLRILNKRREEILAREPEDGATAWRKRHEIGT